MALELWMNRTAVIRNMSARHGYSSELQKLMEDFSNRDLKILQKHPDLIDRLHAVAKMEANEITVTLEEDYGLTLDGYEGNSCWIGTQDLEERIPGWIKTTHVGWAVDGMESFMDFARKFLANEVRMNLAMRYVEYKRKNPGPKIIHGAGFGMYL